MKPLHTQLKELIEEMSDYLYNDGSESDVELVLEAVQNNPQMEGKIGLEAIRKELRAWINLGKY